jgi:hypothetical protein
MEFWGVLSSDKSKCSKTGMCMNQIYQEKNLTNPRWFKQGWTTTEKGVDRPAWIEWNLGRKDGEMGNIW